jgi:hypothetical protein
MDEMVATACSAEYTVYQKAHALHFASACSSVTKNPRFSDAEMWSVPADTRAHQCGQQQHHTPHHNTTRWTCTVRKHGGGEVLVSEKSANVCNQCLGELRTATLRMCNKRVNITDKAAAPPLSSHTTATHECTSHITATSARSLQRSENHRTC